MTNSSSPTRRLFEALLREHAGTLSAYLYASLENREDVDDLFQETCLVAWSKLDTFDQEKPFGPWLRGIARNLVLGRRRSYARSQAALSALLQQAETTLACVESSRGDTFDEKLQVLEHCLKQLPDKYQQAVTKFYIESESVESAASQLKITFEALKKRLHRARTLLRECLSRRGFIPAEGAV